MFWTECKCQTSSISNAQWRMTGIPKEEDGRKNFSEVVLEQLAAEETSSMLDALELNALLQLTKLQNHHFPPA